MEPIIFPIGLITSVSYKTIGKTFQRHDPLKSKKLNLSLLSAFLRFFFIFCSIKYQFNDVTK